MKRKRGENATLKSIPSDVLKIIISFIPFEKNNWLSLRLVNKRFLALCKEVQDPSMRENYPIVFACKTGNVAMVRDLLRDHRVDPSAWWGRPLRFAARGGHAEIVKELLKDPRVDPNQAYNYARLKKEYPEISKENIREGMGYDTSFDETALHCAFSSFDVPCITLLLQDPRTTPDEFDFNSVVYVGYWRLLSLLVGHPNFKRSESVIEVGQNACLDTTNRPLLREMLKCFPETDTQDLISRHILQRDTKIVQDLILGRLGQKPIPLPHLEQGMRVAIKNHCWDIVEALADALHASGSKKLENFFWDVAERGHYATFVKLRSTVGTVSICRWSIHLSIGLFGKNPAIMMRLIEETYPDFSKKATLFAIAACDVGNIDLARTLLQDSRFVASDEQIEYINKAIAEAGLE